MLSFFLFVKRKHAPLFLIFTLALLFAVAYSTLSIVRHLHYESYGYDLGINDQTVWKYSRFQIPVSTIAPLPDRSKLAMHVELVYALLSPLYWIWDSRRMLLIAEALSLVSGSIAAYLLAKRRLKKEIISFAVFLSYIMFFGLQFAVWFDVHSTSFAAAFLMWFIYFLDRKNLKCTFIFFLLTITAKENMAVYTFVITLLYLVRRRERHLVVIAISSLLYMLFVFFVYFPHIMHVAYQYQNKDGLLSNLNPIYLFNTKEKLVTIFYSFLSFGFIPILNPLTLVLIFTHFTTFFVLASDLPGAQGLFGHYRVTLAPLFVWSTVVTIGTFKFLNKRYFAYYLIACTLTSQYFLHLPLSYLAKDWFWKEPNAVANINRVIGEDIDTNDAIASQNNITPHLSHRDHIYTLYPTKRNFGKNSPCNERVCDWFSWYGNPKYIIVDTSDNWDIRHLLADPKDYRKGLANMERARVITVYRKIGNTVLYQILKSPES